MGFADAVRGLRLVDQHAHAALGTRLARDHFESLLTESDRAVPAGQSRFASQLGVALRRWCAPVLGLEPFCPAGEYLSRRSSLEPREVTGMFLRAAGASEFFIDTGYAPGGALSAAEMTELSGARVREIVRLESVAERLAAEGGLAAADFADRFRGALWQRTEEAVAVKSIIAYRHGLNIGPKAPGRAEVVTAAGIWLRTGESSGRWRLTDPVLLRHLLWTAVERGLPVQLHTGFGDPDVRLHRADPALAQEFLARLDAQGVPVVLLHCYPYHRHAAWLAQAYPNVYVDLGLALNYVGVRAAAVLAETLELAPFAQVLYSSDGYGLPELHYLGALLWRQAATTVLGGWVGEGHWAEHDAVRVITMIGAENANRLYHPG